ncbi:MAG: hypothetical protein JO362_22085 [Streptomycetaceae bacterium]|nr:hypothetical protein [Streptomycetaceae bacterium]
MPYRLYRLTEFLSQCRVDRMTGRVLGLWFTEETDGGMKLAEEYAERHQLHAKAFWEDWAGLRTAGLAERVVAPAPGRHAVYALCLRTESIPHGLPEDLARQLRVWALPEEEPAEEEDTLYGRLSEAVDPASWAEPVTHEVTERQAATLAAMPRWEHPDGSPAAEAASELRKAAARLPEEERPREWIRSSAIAKPATTDRLDQWLELAAYTQPETSPLYREGSQLSGFGFSAGSKGFRPSKNIEETKTTPSAAARRRGLVPSGDPLPAVADRVMRRAWAAWRRQLGRDKVILPVGAGSPFTERHSGSSWDDLHRTVGIALRRGATESELVELITHNIPADIGDVSRLVGWRLWRLINARTDALPYRKPPAVKIAAHVTTWDEASPAARMRMRADSRAAEPEVPGTPNPLAEAARAKAREEAERRRAQAEAERRARYARWGISVQPIREPEHVMQAIADELNPPRTGEDARAAALDKARREKRERKQARTVDPVAAARMRARLERLGIRPTKDPE